MTEKRYVEELWAYDDTMVKDNETGEELWNTRIYERMNEQNEQIKELEIELQNKTEKWKYELGMKLTYHSKLIDSEKENEQLKKELKKKFVPFAKADGDYTAVNTEEFIKILNENEQLKEELGSFEQVNFTDMCDGSRTVLYMKKEDGDV